MTEFQDFIERAIRQLGSVASLSRAIGNTEVNIRKWRTGAIGGPNRESIRRLAKATGTSEGDILHMVGALVEPRVGLNTASAGLTKPTVPAAKHVEQAGLASPEPRENPSTATLRLLDGPDAILDFAYRGELRVTEDEIKSGIVAALRSRGWQVAARMGHVQGIDIEARRDADYLVLEAKGEGSLSAMRVNFFVGALGELLQRMDSPAARYGLALPAHRQFARLVIRLPGWVKERLNLCFFFVRPAVAGFEIGVVNGLATLVDERPASRAP